MKDPNICEECHKIGNGCCILKPETYDKMFGLSNMEIQKICLDQNIAENEFIIQDITSEDFVQELEKIDPNFRKMFPNNIRKKLRIVEEKCYFLSDKGCRLSVEARPFYCRIYPFWIINNNVGLLVSDLCLAQSNNDIFRTMELLGITEIQIVNLYSNWIDSL